MSSVRKGRNFELYMHKQLRNILFDVHVQKWSGTKDDPGDLYNDIFLFDCKHVNGYSETDVRNWYKKLENEASKTKRIPVLIIKKSGTRSIYIVFDTKWLPSEETTNAIATFYWKEGTMFLKLMEKFYEKRIS